MDWSNDTRFHAIPAAESATSLLLELLLHHGLNAMRFVFAQVLPSLSTVVFILYTRSHFARGARHERDDHIDREKKILSLYLGILELLIPALQAFTDGLDMGGFAPVNYLMGFVAAITGYVIFDRESEMGYRPSKSIILFVALWALIDLCKTWTYLLEGHSRLLAAGGFATAYIRSQLLTAILTPGSPPNTDLVAFLRRCEAQVQRERAESARKSTREGRWTVSVGSEPLARPIKSQKTKDATKIRPEANEK